MMEKLKLLGRLLVEDTGPFSCGKTIAEFTKGQTKEDGEERELFARRIVACVNFCNGIETEKLEEETELPGIGLFGKIAARLTIENKNLTAQRDSLLSALRALYGWQRAEVEHFGATTPDDFIIEMVEKALKSAEGK